MICTFFGNRNTPKEIKPILKRTIIDLFENKGVDLFYVGDKGNFDIMAADILKELSNTYKISYYVVLAYFPVITEYKSNFDNTILPDKIECVPRKYAIFYRNKWMIKKSDYVVTYISKQIGSGAAKFKEISIKQGKKVIELFNKS